MPIAVSIAPRWVTMIMTGRKSVELRRRGPTTSCIGSHMLIYATRPRSAIVARCRIIDVTIDSPINLWKKLGERSGCSRAEFLDYFADLVVGTAIHLGQISSVEAVGLDELRSEFGWHPPVSWCRIDEESKLALRLLCK